MATDQIGLFNRKCVLQITSAAGETLDLSEFRIVFSIEAADIDHPNTAVIRVYNLKPETMNKILLEFTTVTLQAGYQNGPSAAIFAGSIKQFRKGKETATRTYLDLLCSDADVFYNQGFVSTSLAKGNTPQQVIAAAVAAGNKAISNVSNGEKSVVVRDDFDTLKTGIANPRSKVLFGAARDTINTLASTLNVSWSIQQGVLQLIPVNKYLPGPPIQMSTQTGVVGIPEATNEGLKIQCLINPLLQVGGTIQLNADLINTFIGSSINLAQGGSAGVSFRSRGKDIDYVAKTTFDGVYRIYVIEYEGDTRGQKWYANLTCLATDKTTSTVLTNPLTGG
jgi:hypothetical protein